MKRRLEILDDPAPIEKGAPRYTVRIHNGNPTEDDPEPVCVDDSLDALNIVADWFNEEETVKNQQVNPIFKGILNQINGRVEISNER